MVFQLRSDVIILLFLYSKREEQEHQEDQLVAPELLTGSSTISLTGGS